MGLCFSNMAIYNKLVDENLRKYQVALRTLDIPDKEAKELFEYFFRCDEDNSGEISVKEFFDYVDLERTKFAKRAFSLFDHDGSGQIDFREFVVSMWNYCTFTQQSLIEFAFDLYDLDGSGEIDLKEMQLIVKEVYGSSFRTSAYAKKIMEKVAQIGHASSLDVKTAAQIDKGMFARFTQKHPAMLFPAFRLQQELQKRVMGVAFWKRAAKKRARLFADSTNLKEFMSHINETAFMELATFDTAADMDIGKHGEPPLRLQSMSDDGLSPAMGGAGGQPRRRSNVSDDEGMKRSKTMQPKSRKVAPDEASADVGTMRKVKTHGGDLKSYRSESGSAPRRRPSKRSSDQVSATRRSSRRPDKSDERGGVMRSYQSEASITSNDRQRRAQARRTSKRLASTKEVEAWEATS
uniref:EF-hand domain-containing protein n=1 Tax=Bicosoecida sp. CB-2014 TaxID=1486930 RepID=A0A7S1CAR3_9STRA|mmetsp:Transcript_19665/g.69618  ORF Transcript_19665/g.69618 Transcript_19665/m.69618 type:complete len:408 (+) Transcript_19665:482-1705(+)